MEKILDVEGEVTFDAVDPFSPVASFHFYRLVEVISHRFPSNNDDVAHGVEIEPLIVNDFSPFADRCSHVLVVKGEEPTYDWRQYQDEPHHDSVGVHIWGGLAPRFRYYDCKRVLTMFGRASEKRARGQR